MKTPMHPAILNKIEVTKWVQGTAEKMATAGNESKATWNAKWLDRYKELGGLSPTTTGKKPCPMAAAYGLWYLGMLSGTDRKRLTWDIKRVNKELGKNAAYAVIAAELLAKGTTPKAVSLWSQVRYQFEEQTGDEPAFSEQGEIKLVIALFLEKQLIVSTQ